MENYKVSRNYMVFLLMALLAFSFVLFFTSQRFEPSFVIKYSSDGVLKDSTISKINLMKSIFFGASVLTLIAISLGLLYEQKTRFFLAKHKNLIDNLMLLFLTLIILVAILECAFWFTLKNETSFSSSGPASVSFSREYVKLNKQGFRDYEFVEKKNDNVIRIAVVGDSISFGSGIRDVNDTYPKILERSLNQMNTKETYEVYNFAIPGYDAEDELETIKNKVVKYGPDVVIIQYYENDIENVDPRLNQWEDVDNLQIPVFGFWLREISYTYYFLESRFNKLAENFGLKRKWLDTLKLTYESEENREYNKQIYYSMGSIALEKNFTIVLVVFPVVSDFEDYQFYMVHEFAEEIAEENNFFIIDILESYKNHTSEELSVNKYDYHPNELGHQIAAEEILENFINKSFLG